MLVKKMKRVMVEIMTKNMGLVKLSSIKLSRLLNSFLVWFPTPLPSTSVGSFSCALRTCDCILGEGHAYYFENELLLHLYWIWCLCGYHFWCFVDDGCARVFLARTSFALG